MFSIKDKIFLETSDIPRLKNKINKAIELSKELKSVLSDLDSYNIEFEIGIKKEKAAEEIPPHTFPL